MKKGFYGKVTAQWFRVVCILWILIAVIDYFFSLKLSLLHVLGIVLLTAVIPYVVIRIIDIRTKE
jgi:hypothetical protein